ncbi:hypothetical protein BDV09DRAFT_148444 [Aspergillus tetrazonus]
MHITWPANLFIVTHSPLVVLSVLIDAPSCIPPKSSSMKIHTLSLPSQFISQESETHLVDHVSRATPGLHCFGIRNNIERCALCRDSSGSSR